MKYAILLNNDRDISKYLEKDYYPTVNLLLFASYLEAESLEECFYITNNMTTHKWLHRSLSVGDIIACQNKYSKIWEYHIVRLVGFEVWSAIMSRESPEILFKNAYE